jgi:hypothetical protein
MRRHRSYVALLLGISCLVGLVAAGGVRAASDLPPRPTQAPQPTQSVAETQLQGVNVVLQAVFPEDWDFYDIPWGAPWTAVQWQDGRGNWHTVDGWQGTLDRVWVDAGTVIGQKTWWVPPQHLGTGPFRWVLYQSRDGAELTASTPFTLSQSSGMRQVVEIALPAP